MPAALAAGIVFCLPFLVPLHRLPFPSFVYELLAVVLGLLCALACVLGLRDERCAIPRVVLAPLALLAVVALQAIVGLPAYRANALVFAGYLVWTALMATAGLNLAQALGAARLHRLLAWALLGGGLISAALGLAQFGGYSAAFIFPVSSVPGEGVYGNLAQQNHFATYSALALASAVYLLGQGSLPAWLGLPAAGVLLAALVLSGSRSSVLYLACIGAAWIVCSGKRSARALIWLALAGAISVALLALAANAGLLGSRLARLGSYGGALGPRLFLWQQAWDIFLQHPVLGVGIDRFAQALVEQLRDGQQNFGVDQYAHNLGMQMLAVAGLAGFVALAAPIALFARRLLRERSAPADQWGWALLAILFVHSMLEQPLSYAYFLGIAALLAGSMDSSATVHSMKARASLAVLTVALLAMVIAASDYQSLSTNFYGENVGDPYDARHQELARALHANPLLQPLTELISPGSFVAGNAPVAERLALNTRLWGYAPIAEVAFRQASLLAESGRLEPAKQQFDLAARAYPAETALYAERFAAMAETNPASFQALADHVRTHRH